MGVTEFALNKVLFFLDQRKCNTLYILPSLRPDAVNFSKGRINLAASLSPYIENMFSKSNAETQKITSDHVNLYLRGANSAIKSLDCSLVILDEAAEISSIAIQLARHRLSGQTEGTHQLIALSTPTVDGLGIDALFEDTTQQYFFFPCPHCSRHITLTYPDCLVITAEVASDPKVFNSYYVCPKCNHKLEQEAKPEFLAKAEWQVTKENQHRAGYHISQLFSCARGPGAIAEEALRARYDPIVKAEFYNSCLGLCFVPENARISDVQINDAKGEHLNNTLTLRHNKAIVTLGADIGQKHHNICIVGWDLHPGTDILSSSTGTLMYYGKVESFQEIDDLMQIWRPNMSIIDSQPDTKNSTEISKKYKEICYACWYSQSKNSKQIIVDDTDCCVKVNRTYWMSQTLAKIQGKALRFPRDLSIEFCNHLKAPVRLYKTDNKGLVYSEFVGRENEPDHGFHALTYSIIALGMTAGGGRIIYS